MRLIEVVQYLNVSLNSVATFLSSKGMPLSNWNLNTRLKDKQVSLLVKEYGYKPQFASMRIGTTREKPEVQAVLDEIHHKHGSTTKKQVSKETKSGKKAQRKLLIEQGLQQIKGQQVKLKIKGYFNQVLYTKGYENLFIEGRVQLSDVYYNGSELNKYWAESILKTRNTKTEFVVIDPQVVAEDGKNTFAHLRYNVTPEPSWQIQFKKLCKGAELKGIIIDVVEEYYIVKCILNYNYFIWGTVSKGVYPKNYGINSTIIVRIKHIGANLFAPVLFTGEQKGNENLVEGSVSSSNPLSSQYLDVSPSQDDYDFSKWRETQKKELDRQRELLQTAVLGNNETSSLEPKPIDLPLGKTEVKTPQKLGKTRNPIVVVKCEANFFDDYEVEGQTMSEFLYNDKTIPFEDYLLSSGTIVLRYKLLIALADLMSAYHKANLILGDINPANFEIVSDNPIVLRLIDDSLVSYKTNIIHMPDDIHLMAPEVKDHLSPITPMSECYSFASLACLMLTGKENFFSDIGKAHFIASPLIDILSQSFCTDPMMRPRISTWSESLRFGLDELIYCPQCQQWHVLNSSGRCPICNKNEGFINISLQVGILGEAEIYNAELNQIDMEPTIIGNAKGNVIITEYTSKLLYGYHFGMVARKDTPIAVITLTQCNSNKDVTLHIIPMSGTTFSPLDDNYTPKGEPFEDATDIEISGEDLYRTMFLVESEIFNNKILKLCHT